MRILLEFIYTETEDGEPQYEDARIIDDTGFLFKESEENALAFIHECLSEYCFYDGCYCYNEGQESMGRG